MPSTFAGTWVDPGTSVRQVAVTSVTDEVRSSTSSALGHDSFALVQVAFPLTALTAQKDQVEAVLNIAEADDYMLGVNVPKNVVEVTVPKTSLALERLKAMAEDGRGALTIRMQDIEPLYDQTNKGGVRTWIRTSSTVWSGCTTGFALEHPTYGTLMSTAGHCSSSSGGQAVHNSTADDCTFGCTGSQAGNVLFRRDPDVLVFQRTVVPNVWNSSGYPTVVGQEEPAWLEQNVCYRGATSVAQRCAGVSNVNYHIHVTDDFGHVWNYNGFCLGGVNPQPGDSGSAIYKYVNGTQINAKGLLSVGTGSDACGPTISAVLSATGTERVKG